MGNILAIQGPMGNGKTILLKKRQLKLLTDHSILLLLGGASGFFLS